MPPITITAYESDNNGGWYVAWHDEENLDGLSLDAYIHLTDAKLGELARVRAFQRAPTERYAKTMEGIIERRKGNPRSDRAQPKGPPSTLPWELEEFRQGYEEHIRDEIDRNHLKIPPDAPHQHLEVLREFDVFNMQSPQEEEEEGRTFEDFIADNTSDVSSDDVDE